MSTWSDIDGACGEVQVFQYPAVPDFGTGLETPSTTAFDPAREQAAYERGVRDGESRAREHHEQVLASQHEALLECIRDFAEDRRGYFQRVEREVVELALGIARKILNREAQLDPLWLAGAVHVTLQQLQQGTAVELRVPPADASRWKVYLAEQASALACTVEVAEDPALTQGNCVLRSQLGTLELGLDSQLREVERTLLDLLAKRPGPEHE